MTSSKKRSKPAFMPLPPSAPAPEPLAVLAGRYAVPPRAKGEFSVTELSAYFGGSRHMAQRVVAQALKSGEIEHVGKRMVEGQTHPIVCYRLVSK